ncbi:meiotic nuclear division protein 1 homolog isoform X1 [Portunus trituberculatus]|uniref:meiotic nuclear division protein 1 homolog isoform X1 n=1 Tax=Portunus trituberculatus TaxID=210409 RepID=UPI001E1CF45C|nr:meiotic nuclear division protein 1 homolog isoform X1 [Portunus trituberculatus]XP_045138019.1 meiotic nuclear division protein 1 homolog isoform X1 [Portunus trituberculatus]XP_045138020.1 meiotic nuclear division protein 1 homolog isoform X1 [Portunus trituberculatus]XP_045138021.1 meiotic nuclear division protein 1 homolog isoform X1 [Portunus trituberculatus]
MSRRKGLSHEEKRQKMMELFYEKKDFFQLKELEKIGPKEKGVISQAVKDVVQSLVDDGMVDTEKIGTSVYFWAFPSKAINTRKRKLNDMNSKLQEVDKKVKISVSKVEQAKVGREEDEARTEALASLKELQETQNKLQIEIQKYRESDPEVLAQMKESIQVAQAAANRWTDNIFNIKSWCKNKFHIEEEMLNKQFSIPEELDYI